MKDDLLDAMEEHLSQLLSDWKELGYWDGFCEENGVSYEEIESNFEKINLVVIREQ